MISFETKSLDSFVVHLDYIKRVVESQVRGVLEAQIVDLLQAVRNRMAQLFHPKTGRMQESLTTSVVGLGNQMVGTVRASGLPYLKLQEFGGTVQLPDIFPRRASVLHFFTPGRLGFGSGPKAADEVFATKVRAHPVTLPERSFMRAALARQKSSIIAAFQEAFGDL